MDDCFFQLEMSIQYDCLSWNESSSVRNGAVVSQLMCNEVGGKLPKPESDVLPYGTPKRHRVHY